MAKAKKQEESEAPKEKVVAELAAPKGEVIVSAVVEKPKAAPKKGKTKLYEDSEVLSVNKVGGSVDIQTANGCGYRISQSEYDAL